MKILTEILILIFLINFSNFATSSDLLDEYVRHVEKTNSETSEQIYEKYDNRPKRQNFENLQPKTHFEKLVIQNGIFRSKRHVNENNNSVLKAFGNRQSLKKLIQTRWADKKEVPKIQKRPRRSLDNLENEKVPFSSSTENSKISTSEFQKDQISNTEGQKNHLKTQVENVNILNSETQVSSTQGQKTAQIKSQISSTEGQISSKEGQSSSTGGQNSKEGQNSTKGGQNSTKRGQNPSKGGQDSPKGGQDSPKGGQGSSKGGQDSKRRPATSRSETSLQRGSLQSTGKKGSPKPLITGSQISTPKVEKDLFEDDLIPYPSTETSVTKSPTKTNVTKSPKISRRKKRKNKKKSKKRGRKNKKGKSKKGSKKSKIVDLISDLEPRKPKRRKNKFRSRFGQKRPKSQLEIPKEAQNPEKIQKLLKMTKGEDFLPIFFKPEFFQPQPRYRRSLSLTDLKGSDLVLDLKDKDKRKRDDSNSIRHIPMRWTHHEILDQNGDVVLRWQPRHQEIAFRLEAKAQGFAAVGFTPNGEIKGADLVLGWIDDNEMINLVDCHATDENKAIKDDNENYTLMRGAQNGTHIILEFRRALDTCDSEDFVLGGDTIRVVWLTSETKPTNSFEFKFNEAQRGSQSLYLLGPPAVPVPENTRNWDMVVKNLLLPDTTDTLHFCKIFKAPTLQNKHHIVGWEPIIGKRHVSHLHQMVLRECRVNPGETLAWEQAASTEGVPCYGENMPKMWEQCSGLVVAWGHGSKGETLPEHVGIPFSESPPSYYMLEIHMDNRGMNRATDATGLRVRYTNRLRKNDAGLLAVGLAVTPLHVIPPKQVEYKSVGYCSVDCTRQTFPKEGINIVSVLFHSHETGRKMTLRHIRAGRELSPIVQDNQFDPGYQHPHTLSQETTLLPGDGLLSECSYSTLNRDVPTIGGPRTLDEQCTALILHYPRTQLGACHSMPPVHYFFSTFGIKEFYDVEMGNVEKMFLEKSSNTIRPARHLRPNFPIFPSNLENSEEAKEKFEAAIRSAREYSIQGESNSVINPLERLIIKEPQEFRNKTFISHLKEIPWEEEILTKRFEDSFYSGQHLTFCRKRDDTLIHSEKIELLPNFTKYVEGPSKFQCSYRLQHNSSKSTQNYPTITLIILTLLFKNFVN